MVMRVVRRPILQTGMLSVYVRFRVVVMFMSRVFMSLGLEAIVIVLTLLSFMLVLW